MRERISLDLKAHLGNSRAIFHLWNLLDLRRQQEPGKRRYVLTADCPRHQGAPCEVWAEIEENENGEPVCTLRLPDNAYSPLP